MTALLHLPYPLPLVLLMLGVGISLTVQWNAPTLSHKEWRDVIAKTMEAHAAASIHSCGVVFLGEDGTAADQCVSIAEQIHAPFWVVSQVKGEDTFVWIALHRSQQGQLSQLTLDSYGGRTMDKLGCMYPNACVRQTG
ncbi:hypothetical protein KSF73_09070 [Burkholderiaceae bacterium DAT-1]|nr:hypothetical protein [Burkholderiaceae bacterium DAT-1]